MANSHPNKFLPSLNQNFLVTGPFILCPEKSSVESAISDVVQHGKDNASFMRQRFLKRSSKSASFGSFVAPSLGTILLNAFGNQKSKTGRN